MTILSVNIDHVATVRQARRTIEPDPIAAAAEAELGGAGGITCTFVRIDGIFRTPMCGDSARSWACP